MLKSPLLALAAGLVLAAPAEAARPDLVVTKVRASAAAVAPGATLKITSTSANRGATRAGASTTRFYLSPDPKRSAAARRASRTNPRTSKIDVRLQGERKVGRLKARRRAASKASVTVPDSLSPGAYVVLACADDRGKVRERREANQCRAEGKRVTVTADADAVSPWRSLTDDLAPLDDAALTERAGFLKQASCGATVPVKPIASPKAAVASARAALTARVGAPAMQGFAASPEAATADAAELAAMGLLADGNLGAALVAQLRAAELAPKDADALGNAAALSVSAGMPNEALALLDGAATADRPARVGLAIDRRAAVAQTRGMALLQLGQDEAALGALAAAGAIDPSLQAEAASGQAAQALCAGAVPAAVKALKRAGKRSPEPPAPLDESHGHAATLRPIELPGTPGEAVKMEGQLEAVKDQIASETSAYHDAKAGMHAADNARDQSRIEMRRQDALLDRILAVHERPEVEAIEKQISDSLDRSSVIFQEFWGWNRADDVDPFIYSKHSSAANDACRPPNDYPGCWEARMRETCTPALRGHHQTWLAEVVKRRQLQAQLFAVKSKLMTGIAAHLEDPIAREDVRLMLVSSELAIAGEVAIDAAAWARKLRINQNWCVKSPDGTEEAASRTGSDGAAQILPPDPCNGVSKNLSFVLDPAKLITGVPGIEGTEGFPKLPKVKVSCERVQVSYEFGPSGWAQPFAQIDWKFKAGTVTAFAGVRGKVDWGSRADKVKAGLYLTASSDGIQDVGWRTSPSVEIPVGPVLEVQVKQDIDISFVPAFQDLGALVN